MTTQAVTTWLEGLGLGEYAEAFRANHIDSAMLRDLTDAELQTLGVASLGHRKRLLAGIAALVSPPPAPAPVPDPPPEHPFASLIPRLPTPLALPLVEYLKETEPKLRLWDACDAVEDLLRLLVFLGVGELCRLRGDLPEELRRDFHQAIEQPTLGNWWRMAQQVAQHIADQATDPEFADTALPELPSAITQTLAPFLDGPGGSRTAERSFLALRNQLAHGGVTRRQANRLLQHWQAPFEALWPALAWLADLHLTVRTATGYGRLRGPDITPAPLTPPPAAPIDPAFATQDAVVALRGEQVIPLWPLALFGIPRHPEHGTDPADPPLPQVYVRRGEVNLQYRPLGGTNIVQSESDQTATERFLALFRAPERSRPKDRRGFSVQGFEDSFRHIAGRLIGRDQERATLRDALTATPSGVLWLAGRAGIGKTYLVADLAAAMIADPPADTLVLGYRFGAADAPRCAREPFLRFACERIASALPPADPAASQDDLPANPLKRLKALVARLADQTAGANRVLFLLDGLDEIAERDRRFVHDLPLGLQGPNLIWLCAGRPEQGLPEAFAAAGARCIFPDGLPPMGADDIRAMLLEGIGPLRKKLLRQDTEEDERIGNPFIDRVARLSEGLPLYVKYVVEDMRHGRYGESDAGKKLPLGLHAYHERLLKRLGIGALHQILTPLAATLAVAREPLSAPALADLLHRRGELVPAGEPGLALVHRALGAIQTMLRAARTPEGDDGYRLYHHSLAQHMAESEHDDCQHPVVGARNCLAEQTKTVRTGPLAPYLFRRGIGHLLEIGDPATALGLLTCFDYLMARLRTLPDPDGVEGLAEDWRATLHVSPIPDQASRLWEAFFREREHILRRGSARWPAHKILLQLAMEHADDSPIAAAAEAWLAAGRCDWVWLRNPQRVARAVPSPCLRVLEGHEELVSGALDLPDGRILSWSQDRTLRLWNGQTGELQATFIGHTGSVWGAFLLGNGRFVSWSKDHTLRIWTIQRITPLATLSGHADSICGALPISKGRILSWSFDATLRVWDETADTQPIVLNGHTRRVSDAQELPDRRILSCSDDATLCLWDGQTGARIRTLEGHTDRVYGAMLLPDGRILSWSWDGTLRLWSAESGAQLSEIFWDGEPICSALALPNGHILTTSNHGKMLLWDVENGVPVGPVSDYTGHVHDPLLLPDGRVLTWSGYTDNALRLWDSATMQLLATVDAHRKGTLGAALLPDGQILSWSMDHTLCLWDGHSGTPRATLIGHTSGVLGGLPLPDGRILSWSHDNTLRLWQITELSA